MAGRYQYGFNLGQIEGLDSSVKTVTLTIANATESNTYTLTYTTDEYDNDLWTDDINFENDNIKLYHYTGEEVFKLRTLFLTPSDVGDTYNVTISTSTVEENFKSAVETVLVDNGLISAPETLFDGTITITAEDTQGVEIPFDMDVSAYPFEKWTVTVNGLNLPYTGDSFQITDDNTGYGVFDIDGVYTFRVVNIQDESYPPVPGDYKLEITWTAESGGGSNDNLIIFTYDGEKYSCNKTFADIVTDGQINGVYKAVVTQTGSIQWLQSIEYDDRHAELICTGVPDAFGNIFRYILKADGSVKEEGGSTNLTVVWDAE